MLCTVCSCMCVRVCACVCVHKHAPHSRLRLRFCFSSFSSYTRVSFLHFSFLLYNFSNFWPSFVCQAPLLRPSSTFCLQPPAFLACSCCCFCCCFYLCCCCCWYCAASAWLCLALFRNLPLFFLCHIKIKEWKCAGNAGSAWKTSWRTSKNELQWIIALFALCTRSNAILSNIQLINKDNNNATSRVRLVCCLSLCMFVCVCVSPSTFLCHVHKLQTKLMTASARTAQEASYFPPSPWEQVGSKKKQ